MDDTRRTTPPLPNYSPRGQKNLIKMVKLGIINNRAREKLRSGLKYYPECTKIEQPGNPVVKEPSEKTIARDKLLRKSGLANGRRRSRAGWRSDDDDVVWVRENNLNRV